MLKNSYCILLFYFSLSQFHLVFFRKLLWPSRLCVVVFSGKASLSTKNFAACPKK
jgi:hypothetical protein